STNITGGKFGRGLPTSSGAPGRCVTTPTPFHSFTNSLITFLLCARGERTRSQYWRASYANDSCRSAGEIVGSTTTLYCAAGRTLFGTRAGQNVGRNAPS